MTIDELKERLLHNLTLKQAEAVQTDSRLELVVAGAGSGKTEVMARRIAWWVGVDNVPKENIVAFTFTKKAAEEMKFRVRHWIGAITEPDEDINLGEMYVGTIHGFCLAKLREYWPDTYHNFDILDEAARRAFILRGFNGILGLSRLRATISTNTSQSDTINQFVLAYDQLHEHNSFDVELPADIAPYSLGAAEAEYCKAARLRINTGDDDAAKAFAVCAARYYAYMHCRRFLDFSTSQTEFLRRLEYDKEKQDVIRNKQIHLVVDEVQDINPVQKEIMETIVGHTGKLTAVGDHRQSIYGFRGAKVEIIGEMWNDYESSPQAKVVDLQENFRSTPRIIQLANKWAETISPAGGMATPDMLHGKNDRTDAHNSHVALIKFDERNDEAVWIAEAIKAIVPSEVEGALHDKRDGSHRGIALGDIAVLVRSSTDVRTYMETLEEAGISSVVRAGPDLFSQPEVLLFVAALALSAGINEFYGSPHNSKSLPRRIKDTLTCAPNPEMVFRAAALQVRHSGLSFDHEAEERLLFSARSLKVKIIDQAFFEQQQVRFLKMKGLREFLINRRPLRRVFPQQLYHWLLGEAEVGKWDTCTGRGETAMFHLGTLSSLITGIETPGWTSASDYMWQIIGLCQYGSEDGRTPEQPLIVKPDAVTITTIHAAKGLEFAAVFLADVCARRFPSSYARRGAQVPLSGEILNVIDIAGLADNDNYDGERRLMYVALTRAERFLVTSYSGKQTSIFIKELSRFVESCGGIVTNDAALLLNEIRHAPLEYKRESQLTTSFSDLRYYFSCPHDFYLRKVLGFSPTIDQAFGYGRGVHNLMRVIHSNPGKWAELCKDDFLLKTAIEGLINQGLFYLRYTTGEPAENMRNKGGRVVADYVTHFAEELSKLTFEPEKEFETLVEYEDGEGGALIFGAIDIVRRDDPPRVTLIDFKSGEPESDKHRELDEEEMRLQLGIYAVAAKKELQYEPEKGLVRYLDVNREENENHELNVPLDTGAIEDAKQTVIKMATSIRDRRFLSNPLRPGRTGEVRCKSCDFLGICGMKKAFEYKKSRS